MRAEKKISNWNVHFSLLNAWKSSKCKTAPWVYRLIFWIDNIHELLCWTCQGVEVLMMSLHRTEDYKGRKEWACLSEEDIHCLAKRTPFALGLELKPRTCNFRELTNFHPKLTLLRASSILKLLIVWANVKWICSKSDMKGKMVLMTSQGMLQAHCLGPTKREFQLSTFLATSMK